MSDQERYAVKNVSDEVVTVVCNSLAHPIQPGQTVMLARGVMELGIKHNPGKLEILDENNGPLELAMSQQAEAEAEVVRAEELFRKTRAVLDAAQKKSAVAKKAAEVEKKRDPVKNEE